MKGQFSIKFDDVEMLAIQYSMNQKPLEMNGQVEISFSSNLLQPGFINQIEKLYTVRNLQHRWQSGRGESKKILIESDYLFDDALLSKGKTKMHILIKIITNLRILN